MKNTVFFSFFLLFIGISCSTTKHSAKNRKHVLLNENTFVIPTYATDSTYGYTQENPVKVGREDTSESSLVSGPKNERRYLNALTGPNGERISYQREGSCCPFKTENGLLGGGLLDIYSITWQNANDTIQLYLNMYEHGELKVPVGLDTK